MLKLKRKNNVEQLNHGFIKLNGTRRRKEKRN